MKKTLLALFVAFLATTGLTASEITPQGMEQLKTEWLFQCDDEPTFEKAKQEIGYARDLADRLSDLDDRCLHIHQHGSYQNLCHGTASHKAVTQRELSWYSYPTGDYSCAWT